MKTVLSPNYSKQSFKAGLINILTKYADVPVADMSREDFALDLSIFIRDVCNRDYLLCSDIPVIQVVPQPNGMVGLKCSDEFVNEILTEIFNES